MKLKRKLVFSLLVFAIMCFCGCTNDSSVYNKAHELYENKNFAEAAELFSTISGFKDADELFVVCKFEEAYSLFKAKEFDEAERLFNIVADYDENNRNAKLYARDCKTIQMLRSQYIFAIEQLKSKLKNPQSLQVHGAAFEKHEYTYEGKSGTRVDVFLDYSAQNGLGGMNRDTVKIVGRTMSDEQIEYFFDNLKYISREDPSKLSMYLLEDIDVSSIS